MWISEQTGCRLWSASSGASSWPRHPWDGVFFAAESTFRFHCPARLPGSNLVPRGNRRARPPSKDTTSLPSIESSGEFWSQDSLQVECKYRRSIILFGGRLIDRLILFASMNHNTIFVYLDDLKWLLTIYFIQGEKLFETSAILAALLRKEYYAQPETINKDWQITFSSISSCSKIGTNLLDDYLNDKRQNFIKAFSIGRCDV